MSALLKEIQSDAVNAAAPISNVLRKCAVLAAQLKNDALRDWSFNELNGYPDGDVPIYRRLPSVAQANMRVGAWEHKGTPLASMIMPEPLQDRATSLEFRQPIAALQALVSDGDNTGLVMIPWPGDLVLWVQKEGKFAKGAHVVIHAIWQSVSTAAIVGIIDTVRNRVLEFSLRLGQQIPELLEQPADAPPPQAVDAAQTIYNQVFVYGNNTGAITNASPAAISTTHVQSGDLRTLIETLAQLGIPKGELTELEKAIEDEKNVTLGPKVRGWLTKASSATASGAWKVASGVGVNVISKSVLAYFGIPS